MAFRFALMFPATCRAFHAFVRYKHFEFKVLKGNQNVDGWFLMIVYKMAPWFLCLQMFFVAATLILNGFIDKHTLPGMHNRCMVALICFTVFYMATTLIIDSRESDWNIFKQVRVRRFAVRLICATAFFTCVFPTYRNFLYYVNQRQCNYLATSSLAAITEYLTIIGISGFHFSELFDLDLIHFTVVEAVSK
uniref:ABC2_membrane domain-containing protein n=1 Tax=Panagrellus redivivus TaxID=6233 RepID=A0A7E4W061_PANRE